MRDLPQTAVAQVRVTHRHRQALVADPLLDPLHVDAILGEGADEGAAEGVELAFDSLPEPQLPDLQRPWNTVVTGVGGTGVLTITALVAMAAAISREKSVIWPQ